MANHRNVYTYADLCHIATNTGKICSNCAKFNMNGWTAPSGKCGSLDKDVFAGDTCDLYEPNKRARETSERIRQEILRK